MDNMEILLQLVRDNKIEMNHRLDTIENKLDSLNAFRWKVGGAITLISIILSVGINLAFAVF